MLDPFSLKDKEGLGVMRRHHPRRGEIGEVIAPRDALNDQVRARTVSTVCARFRTERDPVVTRPALRSQCRNGNIVVAIPAIT